MTFESITFTVEDRIATLTLNRPDKMNALNSRMRAEITQAVRDLPAEVRCLVITGTGGAFCSGQDLSDAAAGVDVEATLRNEYEPMLHAISECRVPVIAAVNGTAAGAGANLALVTDVVIAAESASFIQAFTRIGLIPDAGGTWVIPRAVGRARALGLMLFAEPISARQAADWGLIWEAAADAEFEAVVKARADHLARGPRLAYGLVRQAVRTAFDNDFQEQLAVEARLQGQAGRSRDFQEGVVAFLEKRRPNFTGA